MNVTLKRSIGWQQGSAMTIGAVLGSGMLVLPGLAAAMAGPASLVSWGLMGLLTVPLVVVLGSLAVRYPQAGGIAAYARQAFGERAGQLTGYLFLGTVPFGSPICALIGAHYLARFFNLNMTGITLLAGGIMLAALAANYRGIRFSGGVQSLVVAAIAAALLASMAAAWPQVQREAFVPLAPYGWQPVGAVMGVLFWAYVGWEMICHLAEEFRTPAVDIRRSLWLAVVVVNLLYLGLAYVTVGTGVYAGEGRLTALTVLLETGWGEPAGRIVALLGAAACYATIHTYVAGFSRLVYAEARSGSFPAWFGRLHERHQTPHHVLLALTPFTLLVIAANLGGQLDLEHLMLFPSAIFTALYVIAMAAGIKLLPAGSWARRCAMGAMAACVVVYLWNGWMALYPPLLAGGVYWLQRKRQVNRTACTD